MPSPQRSCDQAPLRRSRAGHASLLVLVIGAGVSLGLFGAHSAAAWSGQASDAAARSADPEEVREILDAYCVRCHQETRQSGGFSLDVLDVENPAADPQAWELAIRKLRARTMPPGGVSRPGEADYEAVTTWLASEIDREWRADPNPGRVGAVHRLSLIHI